MSLLSVWLLYQFGYLQLYKQKEIIPAISNKSINRIRGQCNVVIRIVLLRWHLVKRVYIQHLSCDYNAELYLAWNCLPLIACSWCSVESSTGLLFIPRRLRIAQKNNSKWSWNNLYVSIYFKICCSENFLRSRPNFVFVNAICNFSSIRN